MNDELLESVELEVRIAAAKSVREHMQAANDDKDPNAKEAQALDSLTDALITLRTQQIEKMWDRPAPAD